MALKLIASYSKRLGLPAYSSHQFSVSIETELTDMDGVRGKITRLYDQLQQNVDAQIKHAGFVPVDGYGTNGTTHATNGNGHSNGHGQWQCSDKQRDLIIKLIDEHQLDKAEIESLARERFEGKGVKQLNKLEASGLIDELLERVGEKPARPSRGGKPPAYAKGGRR